MCGIWALFGLQTKNFSCICDNFTKISHRGPDAFKIEYDDRIKNGYLAFQRLSIVDSLCGMQPMRLVKYPKLFLLCNGEIYNCKNLQEEHSFEYATKCDVEAIMHLYANLGAEEVAKNLDGVFGLCLLDVEKRQVLIARDPFGVRPLFKLTTDDGALAVSSESKGLIDLVKHSKSPCKIEPFPPGVFELYSIAENGKATLIKSERYHFITNKPSFKSLQVLGTSIHANIRMLLESAVEKRLMAERRIGCLLSGGLDSSLIAGLLVKLGKQHGLRYKIQSFAIGMGESPDIIAARQVAEHIGTEHHEINFTERDIAEVLDTVIYHLETFDITTIRASVGMYLISRYIKNNTSSTVIFSGEGADELAQGYIYFRDAPTTREAHEESVRLLKDIYLFDGLRADRTTSAFSLELRVPFLDQHFSSYYLSLDPELRRPQDGIEKHLLRSAFDETDLLPKSILWRHKEAFSDGVASIKKSLFQIIQDICELKISDEELSEAKEKYPHCTPKTKEALYYRKVFEKHYPNFGESFIPYFWMPRWNNDVTDPSARFIRHYAAEKEE